MKKYIKIMKNFWVVDAFSDSAFKGNPAGVCVVDEFFDEQEMQNIATELNLSETAFVKNIGDRYHIKWFTPNSEAPLCGHATIAASHILMELGLVQRGNTIIYTSLAGDISVSFSKDFYHLNFPKYEIKVIPFSDELRSIIGDCKLNFTGFSHNCILIELESVDELRSFNPNLTNLTQYDCRALIATAFDGEKYDFQSRYFAPKVGIFEDPVCASAHCRLIPYWSKKLQKNELLAYQASKRGGIIKCKSLEDRVIISGQAVTVIKGSFIHVK